MGPLEDVMKMIPGMANNPAMKNVNVNPKDMDHIKAIVYSMTPAERENPDVLNPSRRRRLAGGAGRPIVEVNRMIKQFGEMKKNDETSFQWKHEWHGTDDGWLNARR